MSKVPRVHYKKCEICGVKGGRKAGEKRLFMAKFPSDEERCKIWVQNTGKEDLVYIPIDKLHSLKHLCENHFDTDCFNKKATRLNRTAVPTKMLPTNILPDILLENFPCRSVSVSSHSSEPETYNTFIIYEKLTEQVSDLAPQKKKQETLTTPKHSYDDDSLRTPSDDDKSGLPRLTDEKETDKLKKTTDTKTIQDSKKVLQLRLLEDDNCDVPIYEVLPDKPPEMKVSVTTQCTDVDVQEKTSETEDIEVKIKTEEVCSDKDVWKRKLALVLHTRQFCGVCLCGGGGLSALSDRLEILDGHCTTYGHVVETVFKEKYVSMASSQICSSCSKKLIESYIFIRNAEETWKRLNKDLDELYNKTCYINNNNYLKDNWAGSKIFNVVIALDKGKADNFTYNDINTEEPKSNKKHLHHLRDRRRFKCLSCNVRLPSYRAWKVHEATTHRKYHRCRICLQSFKTRQDFTAHYRTHLKSRCSICHRTVIDGRLVHHLKRRHKHSAHMCSTCNVAFYSAKALNSHNNECHYSDSKCATCLQSLSEVELEEHQCRFKCPECIEAPCVHHKYLMSYREQMLNLAPRARCLHCSYVCTSKGALVTHVNARHLNVQPYSCVSCRLKFYSASNLRSHVCESKTRHKYSHVCEHCDKPYNSLKLWQQHRKDCEHIQRQFRCEYCPANFDSLRDLSQHRKVKHGTDKFSCDICDREFLNAKKRNKHAMLSHGRARAFSDIP